MYTSYRRWRNSPYVGNSAHWDIGSVSAHKTSLLRDDIHIKYQHMEDRTPHTHTEYAHHIYQWHTDLHCYMEDGYSTCMMQSTHQSFNYAHEGMYLPHKLIIRMLHRISSHISTWRIELHIPILRDTSRGRSPLHIITYQHMEDRTPHTNHAWHVTW